MQPAFFSLGKAILEKRHNVECIRVFISLMKSGEVFTKELRRTMVEQVKVEASGEMRFTLAYGLDVDV